MQNPTAAHPLLRSAAASGRARRSPNRVPLAPPRRNGVVHQEGGVRLGRPSPRTSIRSASHLPASASTRRIAADTASSRLLGSVGPETDLGSAVIRPTEPAPRARESERVPRCSPSGTRRVPLGKARMGSRKSERDLFGGLAGSRVIGGSSVAIGRGASRGAFCQPKRRLVSLMSLRAAWRTPPTGLDAGAAIGRGGAEPVGSMRGASRGGLVSPSETSPRAAMRASEASTQEAQRKTASGLEPGTRS